MTIDITSLRAAHASSPVIAGIFDVLAGFANNRSVTKVHRIVNQLYWADVEATHQQVVAAFKQLAELGLGSFIRGAHGYPSRMQWHVQTRNLRDWVLDEQASDEEIHEALEGEEVASVGEDWVAHSLVLRRDLTVEFELPANLSGDEAGRLSAFFTSAAFDADYRKQGTIERVYYLRPDMPISIELPADLTDDEAYRLQNFAGVLLQRSEEDSFHEPGLRGRLARLERVLEGFTSDDDDDDLDELLDEYLDDEELDDEDFSDEDSDDEDEGFARL